MAVERSELLAVRSNVVVRLGGGVVARVGGLTAEVRDVREHFGREVALTRALARAGAPAVRPYGHSGPRDDAGPHEHAALRDDAGVYEDAAPRDEAGPHEDGRHVVTLWEEVPPGPPPPGEEAGPALRACHEALAEWARASTEPGGSAETGPPPLPSVSDLLAEARGLLDRSGLGRADALLLRGHLARAAAEVAAAGLPEQPLHGDAGPGNVLPGPVWNDWEDCCSGPVAWDLGCMVSTSRVLGIERERAEAALAAYGPFPGDDALDVFIHARAAQTAAWSAFSVAQAGGDAERLAGRLGWLRAN